MIIYYAAQTIQFTINIGIHSYHCAEIAKQIPRTNIVSVNFRKKQWRTKIESSQKFCFKVPKELRSAAKFVVNFI